MKIFTLARVKEYLRTANQWLLKTPERALNEAYEAALMIRSIENEHFGGNRISVDFGNYGVSTQSYFQSELTKYLNIVKVRLAEFKVSSPVVNLSASQRNQKITEIQLGENSEEWHTINVIDKPSITLRKLRFIDEVLDRYSSDKKVLDKNASSSLIQVNDSTKLNGKSDTKRSSLKRRVTQSLEDPLPTFENRVSQEVTSSGPDVGAMSDRTSFLPRSILRTVDRLKQELNPQAEEEVVKSFRSSKAKTIISFRFILLLIILPLLTQQMSKNWIVGPIIDQLRGDGQTEVFLNLEMEEEALHDLQRFEERLKFEVLIGKIPPMPQEELETVVRRKAAEVEETYRKQSGDAIKNVFADILSMTTFAGMIYVCKREIAILKSFIDEIVYGLSDSAKAFIIILFTDIFVGFHSPHGWEVLLEGLSRHLGLPANRDFIFLFIATFPVILDTVFKYWIFRYLNRISPSAVATYKNMNE